MMNLTPESIVEWASNWVPEANRARFAEALAQELRALTEPGPVGPVIEEYDAVVAGIPPETRKMDGGEADFVMRVDDYLLLRAAIVGSDVSRSNSAELPGPELGRHDALPCDVIIDNGEAKGQFRFNRGVKLGTLLDYLARRVTYNTIEESRGNCSEADRG